MNPHSKSWMSPDPEWPRLVVSPRDQAAGDNIATSSDLLALTRRHRLAFVIWMFVCLGAAAWYIVETPASYTATATIILEAKYQPASSDSSGRIFPGSFDNAQVENQLQIIRSERLLRSVFDKLQLRNTPESSPGLLRRIQDFAATLFDRTRVRRSEEAVAFNNFVDRVSARRIGQSYVVEIMYTSGNPDNAARLANSITSAYIGQQVALRAAAGRNRTDFLQVRIADLKAELDAADEAVAKGVISDNPFPDADSHVISAAVAPLEPTAPRSVLVIAFAGTLGLLIGALAVALLNAFDRKVRTASQLWRLFGLECLTTIPRSIQEEGLVSALDGMTLNAPAACLSYKTQFSQAIENVRTAILLSTEPGRPCVVGIASWTDDDGRSAIVAGLASSVARSMEAVTIIDADLSNGKLTAALAPRSPIGLREALTDSAKMNALHPTVITEYLGVIPASGPDTNAPSFAHLGSLAMQKLIADRLQHGHVIVDLPALSKSSDARALSPFIDSIVLVVQTGKTTLEMVVESVRAFQSTKANVIGAILVES